MAEKLAELHLADLHALAAELGVERFRMLRRDELVREIEAKRGSGDVERPSPGDRPAPAAAAPAAEPEGGDAAIPAPERERELLETDETEEIEGVLEVTPQRYGFLRVRGLEADPEDVYVSASQIRRCQLRTGDRVGGPVRAARRGERHRALVHVDRVNGAEPRSVDRPEFERLTPIVPTRRLTLDGDPADVLTRAVDLLTPVALGQRVLVEAAPRSGRTTLLRGLARAIAVASDVEVTVLLIDERPEEATAWREEVAEAEIASATADLAPIEQSRLAELALGRVRRRAEEGRDAVLIVDSLSRLAVASGDAATVKRLFGSGRELAEEGAGSVTVIATVVEGAEDEGAAEQAVATTESSLIRLDPSLAAAGIFPALRAGECRISNEDELRGPDELAAVRRLRSLLADLDPAESASLIRERIEGSRTNAELLRDLS